MHSQSPSRERGAARPTPHCDLCSSGPLSFRLSVRPSSRVLRVCSDGRTVGRCVGVGDGKLVGRTVGDGSGTRLGAGEGRADGRGVGSIDGSGEGALLGAGVG